MFRIVCVLFIIFFPLCSYGDESSSQGAPSGLLRSMPMLASDEPNVLGWTRDSYERAGFMDFI